MSRASRVAAVIEKISTTAMVHREMVSRVFGAEGYGRGPIDYVINSQMEGFFDRKYPRNEVYEGVLDRLPEDLLRDAMAVATDQTRLGVWRQHKVIYDIDPELWESLGDLDLNQKMWTQSLRSLPHPDPFVVFPSPIMLHKPTLTNGYAAGDVEVVRFVGMLVGGLEKYGPGYRACSTSDEARLSAIGVTFVGFVEDVQGNPVYIHGTSVEDGLWQGMSIDIKDEPVLLSELADTAVERFTVTAGDRVGNADTYLPSLIGRALAVLMYLCTRNADMQTDAPTNRPAKKAKTPAKAKPKVYRVGYKVGDAIRLFNERKRQASAMPREEAETTGRRGPRPYQVRPFIRGYWTGKGRAVLETRFIAGYWAALDNADEASEVTIRPVKS